MAFKPVGVDEQGRFPKRVEERLNTTIATEVQAPARAAATEYLAEQDEVVVAAATRAIAVAADPAVAALVTPTTATGAAMETAFGPAPVTEEKVVYVSARGNDSNDGSSLKRAKATLAAAIAEAGDASARIEVAAGTFDMGPGIQVRSQVAIVGQGAHTSIAYSGTGTAIGSATPDGRTYRQQFRNLRLNGPGKTATGTVGIDLASMSEVVLENVTVTGFATGIRSRSSLSGGSVYNRAWNVTVQNCDTGWDIAAPSNAFTAISSRASSCDVGFRITNSNNVTLLACQIESNDIGVEINATSAAGSDFCSVLNTRFEQNTTAWAITSSQVRYATIDALSFGTYDYIDNGLATNHISFHEKIQRSHNVNPDGSWIFERTQNGGEYRPAMVVRDTNTTFGSPVQYQAESGRTSGVFFRGVRAGVTYFDVDARGGVFMGNRTRSEERRVGKECRSRWSPYH